MLVSHSSSALPSAALVSSHAGRAFHDAPSPVARVSIPPLVPPSLGRTWLLAILSILDTAPISGAPVCQPGISMSGEARYKGATC
jgi:hypothetical protein